ncbi:MAG: hypothetical protein HGB26_06165 [Desulfobulbaceae bacterium]|nr:hypothetical protein [Desulfobulbaceae bacterium]
MEAGVFLQGLRSLFERRKKQKTEQDYQQESRELYKTIGQLKVEVDWLKKNAIVKVLSERRSMVKKEHTGMSKQRQ